ncbi:hypothetical protein TNCV_3554301 [Trichonephila clavipes]|nr:hypothetical protein TNCV_3554301 [Trichonephila clavipes]
MRLRLPYKKNPTLVEDETDEDEDNNNESSKGPSNADVFSALETECGHGPEFMADVVESRAQDLMSLKTRDVERLRYFKSVEFRSPHVGLGR